MKWVVNDKKGNPQINKILEREEGRKKGRGRRRERWREEERWRRRVWRGEVDGGGKERGDVKKEGKERELEGEGGE